MADLASLVARINKVCKTNLEAGHYSGYYSKKLTKSSSLAVKRSGHGYHLEITDPNGPMLVFPLVTSAAYEANPTGNADEKKRFFLRLDLTLLRSNLLTLVKRMTATSSGEHEFGKDYYEKELQRLQKRTDEKIASTTHCTFAIRGTAQRQMEIGTSSDQEDFILLRRCLMPDDYLIFLARGPGTFDAVGLPGDEMSDQAWDGWAVGDPGKPLGAVRAAQVKEEIGGYEAPAFYGTATEAAIASVVAACEQWGSRSIVALAGVPGTGKSYIAGIAAQRYTGDKGRVREIQFHQSFSYEEFIEGLRIAKDGDVRVEPGVFLDWNDKAAQDPGHRYVLLVEELTRANISAVLGELMTYLEHRERGFFTVYSRKKVYVAPNLVILATYNPTDRSAIEVDAALLRRMRVLSFPPSVEQLAEMLGKTGLAPAVIKALQEVFLASQKEFPDQFEYSMPFGHGLFADIRQEQPDLGLLWEQRIRHLLRPPVLDPHQFTQVIEKNYPWLDGKSRIPEAGVAQKPPEAGAQST